MGEKLLLVLSSCLSNIHSVFTLLESPGIYAGDGGNRKYQLLVEGGVKAPPFPTGFILL
jgi:hypothetical protein